jgi:uncharacterized protein YacL
MSEQQIFEASSESKAKAKQYRIIAVISWLLAMAGQVFAILKLINNETMVWLIVAIIVILIFAILGSYLWKKANRLDPASEKNKTKFFIQNQLGAILGVLAFLPLVIFIFTNKNLDGKTKGIAGSIAVIAMLVAGVSGVDFNPPSVEKYTKEINEQNAALKDLNVNSDNVYWTSAGNKYHINKDCYHIDGKTNVTNGSVKLSFDQRGISELCKTCKGKAEKANILTE